MNSFSSPSFLGVSVNILDFPLGLLLFVTLGAALGKGRTSSGVNTILGDGSFSLPDVVKLLQLVSEHFFQERHLGLQLQ